MASTPSKDYKRREREQRKFDKRMAREAAKAEKLAAQYAAEDAAEKAAAEEAAKKSEAELKAKEEAEFEAELEAELARRAKVQGASTADLYLSTELKQALDTAQAEATQLGDEYVSTEHLLLGLLAKGGSALGRVFKKHNLRRDALLDALKEKKIAALAVQDPFRMGYTAVKNIVAAINGEDFEAQVDTGAVLLDLDNIDSEKIRKLLRKPAN